MNWLRILSLRVWIGLLRIERAARLDAVLTTYGACPEKLTSDLVSTVLADVDTDIARAQARIETLPQPEPWPGTAELVRRGGARIACKYWLVAAAAVALLFALSGCGQAPGPTPEVSATTTSGFRVERLFTVDGCTVYRFKDSGDRYFTNCSGSTGWEERAGKTSRPAGVVGGKQV